MTDQIRTNQEPIPAGMGRLPIRPGFRGEVWQYTDDRNHTAILTIQPTGVVSISTDDQASGAVDADLPPSVLAWLLAKVNAQQAPAVSPDARARLARWLFLQERTDEWASREWPLPQHVNQEPWLAKADKILAVIATKEA